jgi:hypothetical protein
MKKQLVILMLISMSSLSFTACQTNDEREMDAVIDQIVEHAENVADESNVEEVENVESDKNLTIE